MPRPKLSEHEVELLADLVESPGWQVLAYKLLTPLVVEHTEEAVSYIGHQNLTLAAAAVGRREGIIEALKTAYSESGVTMPDVLKARTKGMAA